MNTETAQQAWQETEKGLYRKFEFADFSEAFAFMTRVALAAEKANHHPTWTNTYNTVEFWLNTHDAGGGVTDKDRTLAGEVDKLCPTPTRPQGAGEGA